MTALGKFAASIVDGNIVTAMKRLRRRTAAVETATGGDAQVVEMGGSFVAMDTTGVRNVYARIDGAVQVLQLNQVDHTNGSYHITRLPAGALLGDNVVEFEMTGMLLQSSGGTLALRPRVLLGTGGPDVVTSGATINIATSNSYRSWRYNVKFQQGANLGNFVQVEEELRVDSLSPLVRTTLTQLTYPLEQEQELWMQLSFVSGTSYVNLCFVYDTWTFYVREGISETQQRFWTQPTGARGYDNHIASHVPTTNLGSNAVTVVGNSTADAGIRRTLIKFSDIANLPSNAVIDAAYLWQCVAVDSSSNARTFEVYRLLRDWGVNTSTWNTYDGTNNWTTAGAGGAGTDYDNTVVWASTSFSASETVGTFKLFNLNTTEFTKFVNGTYPNYGWIIRAQTESNDAYQFHSADAENGALAPKLEVLWHYPE